MKSISSKSAYLIEFIFAKSLTTRSRFHKYYRKKVILNFVIIKTCLNCIFKLYTGEKNRKEPKKIENALPIPVMLQVQKVRRLFYMNCSHRIFQLVQGRIS